MEKLTAEKFMHALDANTDLTPDLKHRFMLTMETLLDHAEFLKSRLVSTLKDIEETAARSQESGHVSSSSLLHSASERLTEITTSKTTNREAISMTARLALGPHWSEILSK